jgi:hypothetical protein
VGEIVEAVLYLYAGIVWSLGKAYEKCTGRELGLVGALGLLLISVVICSGVLYLVVSILFLSRA